METVNFENKNYVWEEVKGKGRCLVPYVKPKGKFDDIKPGTIILHGSFSNMVFELDNKWCLIETARDEKLEEADNRGTSMFVSNSREELINKLNSHSSFMDVWDK